MRPQGPKRACKAAAAAAPRSKTLLTLLDRAIWLRWHHPIHSAVIAERVLQTIPRRARMAWATDRVFRGPCRRICPGDLVVAVLCPNRWCVLISDEEWAWRSY